jgi:hypothetical protein
VSVKDRVPKYGALILVTCGKEVACCKFHSTDAKGHHFTLDGSNHCLPQDEFDKVTYWAELPAPPRAKP